MQYVQNGTYEKVLESHGVALQEMANAFFCNHSERRQFMKTLERVLRRLVDVEKNGYSPPDLHRSNSASTDNQEDNGDGPHAASSPSNDRESAAAKKKKKKKKKKQAQKEAAAAAAAAEAAKSSAPSAQSSISSLGKVIEEHQAPEDPLVTALLGMGFTQDQISAAVKACGGTNRATADDLVTWILTDGSGEATEPDPSRRPEINDN